MHQIEALLKGKKDNPKDIVGNIMYIMARDLHIGYRELKTMPLIDVLGLLERWEKEQEANKKEAERIKKR